jgi:hypothetical protein
VIAGPHLGGVWLYVLLSVGGTATANANANANANATAGVGDSGCGYH